MTGDGRHAVPRPPSPGPQSLQAVLLLHRPASTLGLVFSRTGFTDPARHLSYFSLPQTILLWSGEELKYALERESICELLLLKYRVCVEDGLPDYDVRERDIL